METSVFNKNIANSNSIDSLIDLRNEGLSNSQKSKVKSKLFRKLSVSKRFQELRVPTSQLCKLTTLTNSGDISYNRTISGKSNLSKLINGGFATCYVFSKEDLGKTSVIFLKITKKKIQFS